ncbi:MAG: DegT/DnrJ/EryC1/StrS family aminotransferase [Armatimonadetes bacterium]|nr:DegT/DnrJ/EryC1/StrS family aminotransferase [Armatimonadota bacterium]
MASKLALEGGTSAVPEGMVKSWPPITQADKEAVLEVFDSDELHGIHARKARELEERWAAYIGTKYALVANSGTATLHMAIAAAGIGPGDEVITSAFTYWSTAAAILHNNAIPVFVDIDPRTYTIDPALIEERITDRTRAILPVHIHGMPADMDPIMDIARRHGLVVIGDCCQAHGATYKGVKVGKIEDMGCFSCNRSKNLSGGEGGLFTTDNEQYWRHADMMRRFGEVPGSEDAGGEKAYTLGWMYRPHEFINAFILSQLDRLDEYNAVRRQLANFMTAALEEIPGFAGPYTPEYAEPCYFTYVVEFRPHDLGLDVEPREFRLAMEYALAAEGVRMHQWQSVPVPAQDVFQARVGYGKGCPWTCPFGRGNVCYDPAEYPRAWEFVNSHSYLPGVYPPNDLELMRRYVDAFAKVSENATRVLELYRKQIGQ